MILVTGATGHLGRATIDFLLTKLPATEIAAFVRDENKAADLIQKGVSVRVGNYHDYDSLVEAFKDVEKVLLISSADMDDRFKQHANVIDAAKQTAVQHVLYTSADVKDITNSSTGIIAQDHNNTANYLKQSGLAYTLLNNNLYADVLPVFLGEKVLETGVYFAAGEGKVPFATRNDMAEAAANILTGTGHENKEYTISADVAYSFKDIAAQLSEVTGKKLGYTSPTNGEFKQALTAAGVPGFYVDMLGNFAEAIKNDEFNTQTSDLEKLLGRKPTLLKTFLQEVYGTK